MPTPKRRISQAAIVTAFGERLREMRLARGMTQRELAEKAQVTLSYVSKLESGGAAPGLDLIQRLAEATKVEIPDLLPPRETVKLSEQRKAVHAQFEALLANAGEETLKMLESLLLRMADSHAIRR